MNPNRAAMTPGNDRVRLGGHGAVPKLFDKPNLSRLRLGGFGYPTLGNIDFPDLHQV
ncbi:MAG TPA: hypothetical protein VFX20_23005 [Steroidobacteraceae bacterium]|nr:hypothetical protein [Steroidobacteraceae bacterium]